MEHSIKLETYRIQYVDNTYQLVEWTEEEFHQVAREMAVDKTVVVVDKCLFRLKDIRAIVYLPPVPEEEEPPKDEKTVIITEVGSFDRELYDTLVENGYDLGDVLGERGSNE